MKVDVAVVGPEACQVSALARLAEDIGFDALHTAELQHDPFPPLALAAEKTERIGLGTSIAVSFPRSPIALAQLANDLQEYSRGRFVLGLGSPVRTSAEDRFGAPFGPPIRRMREIVLALRASWQTWQSRQPWQSWPGEVPRIRQFFTPPPHPYGPPKIHLAAVGARMAELAGEVADGLILRGFTTARYLRETTVPALERGLRRSGRGWDDLEVVAPGFIVTGSTGADHARAERRVRRAIAFHGATPAYRPLFDAHGLDGLHEELSALARRGDWARMPALIDQELIEAVAVRGELREVPDLLVARYGSVCRRVRFAGPFHHNPGTWAAVVSRVHEITSEPVPS